MTEHPFTHEPDETIDRAPGIQYRFRFPNGWAASVVRGPYTYGGPSGLFELAVTDHAGHLSYDTDITNDVEGYLTPADVDALLARIAALTPQGSEVPA